jgi:NTE family protein
MPYNSVMQAKIGLVLSGGGARGLAHIGVLKVLEKENITFDFIAGTSMGAILGAAYASGKKIEEIEDVALKFSRRTELIKLLDLSPRRRGLLEGHKVREFLGRFFGDITTFEQLKIPMAINAVDLKTGKEIVFTSGELLPPIYASSAIPGLFSPVPYQNYFLVDGGVLNNLPVDRAREMGANFIIAVNVHSELTMENDEKVDQVSFSVRIPGFFRDSYNSLLIMMNEMTQERIKIARPEIILSPKMPPKFTSITGFTHIKEIIDLGSECAESALLEIHKKIRTPQK